MEHIATPFFFFFLLKQIVKGGWFNIKNLSSSWIINGKYLFCFVFFFRQQGLENIAFSLGANMTKAGKRLNTIDNTRLQ